jgi:hypothetical protein
MQPGVTNSPLRPTNKEPISVTGDNLLVQGEQSVSFSINDYKFRHIFLVCKLPTTADGLVGMDFLAHWSTKLDIGNKALMLASHRDENFQNERGDYNQFSNGSQDFGGLITLRTATPTPNENSLNVAQTTGGRPSDFTQEGSGVDFNVTELLSDTRAKLGDDSDSPNLWVVRSSESVTVGPKSKQAVYAKLMGSNRNVIPSPVCVEPVEIPISGVLAARVLTRMTRENHASEADAREREATARKPKCKDTLNNCKAVGTLVVMVANFSAEPLDLPRGTVIGTAEEMAEDTVAMLNCEDGNPKLEGSAVRTPNKVDIKTKKYLRDSLAHLSDKERAETEPVLMRYAHVFHDDESGEFGKTDLVRHRIETGNAPPIRKVPYRVPHSLRGEMEERRITC